MSVRDKIRSFAESRSSDDEPIQAGAFSYGELRRLLALHDNEIARAKGIMRGLLDTEPRICPACGADYAEAEAKNERLAKPPEMVLGREFYSADDEVHDGSREPPAPVVSAVSVGAAGTIAAQRPWRSDCGHVLAGPCDWCAIDKAAREPKP